MSGADAKTKTLAVIILTLATMAAEIFFGILTHSMALTADGWHMGTHAFALSITFFAYILAAKLANCDKFSISTDKIGTLAGFVSSILLGVTGVWILFESVMRFFNPLEIHFGDAIVVAIIGLAVNLLSILIMGVKSHTHSCTEHGHGHSEEQHKDYNFIAAYMHILADALTSFFAIFALLAGKYFNLVFLDPLVGVAGGVLICIWAYNLIKSTSLILLDYRKK
ncbi:TPA: cation transporter [Candidatus Galligastranaerophilus faecipullorum]|nr:cation transporter [Candidatus Galligastranaerophilus faecipullorum]